MITEELYLKASEEIDKAHSMDTSSEIENAISYPSELLYSRHMIRLLDLVSPASSYALKLAVQCQHLKRWNIPRANFPYDRGGYHQWRRAVMVYQIEETRKLLSNVGLEDSDVNLITDYLQNQYNKSNPNSRIIVDTACLVFVKWHMESFAAKHQSEKVLDIMNKTLRKMSVAGINLISKLDLSLNAHQVMTEAGLKATKNFKTDQFNYSEE